MFTLGKMLGVALCAGLLLAAPSQRAAAEDADGQTHASHSRGHGRANASRGESQSSDSDATTSTDDPNAEKGSPSGFSQGRKTGWHGASQPPGFSHGQKKGWRGGGQPPGWSRGNGRKNHGR